MHELSICGAILDIVTRHGAGRRVEVVHVRIGQLRQVVPDTLEYCWQMVTAESPLAGSRIEIETVPARIACRACGSVADVGPFPVLLCSACESADVRVEAGEEFLLTSLELAQA